LPALALLCERRTAVMALRQPEDQPNNADNDDDGESELLAQL
jgi:hypothetical protein